MTLKDMGTCQRIPRIISLFSLFRIEIEKTVNALYVFKINDQAKCV